MNKTSIKLRDVMDNYRSRIDAIILKAASSLLSGLEKNGFSHSRSIEENLNLLITDEIKKGVYSVERIEKGIKIKEKSEKVLWEEEIFVLLCSVYLHDIGYRFEGKLVSEGHEKRSHDMILSNYKDYLLRDKFEALAVAEVCYGHAKESEYSIKKVPEDYSKECFKYKPVNLRAAAALLRIADDMDTASMRLSGISVIKEADVIQVEYVVPIIKPDYDKWCIVIESRPDNWESIRRLERERNYLQRRLDEVKENLERKKLFYHLVWLDPVNFYGIYGTPKPEEVEIDEIKELVRNLCGGEEDRKIKEYKIDVLYEDKEIKEIKEIKEGLTNKNAVFVNIKPSPDLIESYNKIFKSLKEENEIARGIIVFKKTVDEKLKETLPDYVSVLTLDDFIRKAYNLRDYLKKSALEYSEDAFHEGTPYVSLRGHSETREGKFKVDDYLDEWLSKENEFRLQLTLLGDVVTGKSTIAKRFFLRQSERYFKNPESERIPILIELKDYQSSRNLEEAVTLSLNKHIEGDDEEVLGVFRKIKALNESGRLLLILNGFEKMARKNDSETIFRCFREIDSLVNTKSKIFITSRTEYFRSKEELDILYKDVKLDEYIKDKKGYEIITLMPFEQKDVESYLEKFFGADWKEKYETIKKIYDLEELSQKPILLELICETLKNETPDENVKLNSALLYDKYTGISLGNKETVLNAEEKKFAVEEMAVELFLKDTDKIQSGRLFENIKNKFYGKKNFDKSAFDKDIKSLVFISKDRAGNYSFARKSFMEFFTAKKLSEDLESGHTEIFGKKLLPHEIIGFLCNLARDSKKLNKLYDFILLTREKTQQHEALYLGRNAISVLNAINENFSGKDLSNTNLNNSYLHKANLESVKLKGAVLDHSNLNGANLKNAELQNSRMQRAYLKGADLRGANMEGAILCDADLRGANLENAVLCSADLRGANMENTCLKGIKLHGAKLENTNLRKVDLRNSDLKGVNLELVDLRESTLSNADLRESKLSMAKLNEANLQNANLEGADLKFANFVRADLRYANMQNIGSESLDGVDFSYADLTQAKLKNFGVVSQVKRKIKSSSNDSGSIEIRLRRKIDITEMNIKNADGLSAEDIEFLKDRGAIEK